jgi:predicted peptidase
VPKPKPSLFYNPDDPSNLNELSEKDVMNVLDIICKEFNVDENRIYLMGHSMGGAGTLYLGTKYPDKWAALGPIAPAAFTLNPDILASIKEMPVIIVQGDKDNMVPVANTRRWVDKLKELNMTYEYNEMTGGDHGSVIFAGLPSVYEFFSKHSKSK